MLSRSMCGPWPDLTCHCTWACLQLENAYRTECVTLCLSMESHTACVCGVQRYAAGCWWSVGGSATSQGFQWKVLISLWLRSWQPVWRCLLRTINLQQWGQGHTPGPCRHPAIPAIHTSLHHRPPVPPLTRSRCTFSSLHTHTHTHCTCTCAWIHLGTC